MKIFGLFNADWIWTLIPICGFLWATGGSGWLPARRFGVPLTIMTYALGYGMTWQKLIITTTGLSFFAWGPGYGDYYVQRLKSFYWPYIAILGLLYGLCQFGLCLQFGGWMVLMLFSGLCSIVFFGTLYGSKKFDFPRHKIHEILTGAMVGIVAAKIIS